MINKSKVGYWYGAFATPPATPTPFALFDEFTAVP